MKTAVVRTILIASVAVIASFVLTYNHDYRWIGHVVAGLATAGFLAGSVSYGLAQAGRLRQRPSPGTFRLHRELGITLGFVLAATFLYGLWIMLPQNKELLRTVHGVAGLIIVILAVVQIAPSLTLKRRGPIRLLHRWSGYLMTGVIVFQIILGVTMLPLFVRTPPVPRVFLPWLTPMESRWQPDGIIGPNEYFTSRTVDNGNYEIHYRSDGQAIYIAMKAKTAGWVGVGIERGEGMKNAGMVVGYVTGGKAVVDDSFGTSKFSHLPDANLGGTDNIIESGGREEGGFTVIEFSLPLRTGDSYDVPLVEGVQRVIWAYGATDSPGMHTARGHLEIDFASLE